ncbi:MerR family transcriptional regulator [Planococcus sp. N064]|uniref:MerR family transcriptional regulator n=1 Tax=Planococcus liqunii TaxID=3058394 RepID=A0ABT8MPC8_9BACL|nr:MerR family transcriptional regulator [Planococcus sp. N064]MDN7226631.1 MerR family transcriptional regulator [Planococcus sp. N064]
MYKVQEVAKIAGVSVRTLHHYDSVGLLKPSNIGSNRYRYYSDEDLKLLQHILFFKELGFSLKKIQEIVAEGFDPKFALVQHAELLEKKKARIEKLIQNAERTKQELEGLATLSNSERFDAFSAKKSDDTIEKYKSAAMLKAEAPVQSTDTEHAPQIDDLETAAAATPVEEIVVEEIVLDAQESPALEELHDYEITPPAEEPKPEKEEEDLEEINREGNRIYNAVASLMHLSPDAPQVQTEMKAYYVLLNRFYDCTPKMFRGLADLYASDSRFANNIDQHGKGLSKYLKEAMYIHAESMQQHA